MNGHIEQVTSTFSFTHAADSIAAFAAAYSVRVAGVKLDTLQDAMPGTMPNALSGTVSDFIEGCGFALDRFMARHTTPDTPLRAALPGTAADAAPLSRCMHPCAQTARRAPIPAIRPEAKSGISSDMRSGIKTGHSDFLAVLDHMGARHRSAYGLEGLQAAFAPLDEPAGAQQASGNLAATKGQAA